MRVAPITAREQLAPEHHAAFDEVVATYGGNVVGPLRVLFHSPELARRISGIGAPMRLASPFPSVRELAIISAAREWDCLYEWFVHEPAARRVGVSEAAIEAVRANGPLTGLPKEEAEVVSYVRNLLRSHRVPDGLFKRMVGRLGVRGIVEISATIGFYQIFACVMNAFEVPADRPVDLAVRPRRGRPGKTAQLALRCGVEPRIPLITSSEELPEEQHPLFDEIAARGRSETGTLRVLLHVPELARFTAMAEEHIRNKLTLPEDIEQIAILATAQASRCPCLWEGHEALALKAGVPPQVIAAAGGNTSAGRPPRPWAQVIGFTRRLVETNRVPEGEFQAMLGRLGLKGLVELAALIGFSGFMACILNAFEVQCRASAPALTARAAAG